METVLSPHSFKMSRNVQSLFTMSPALLQLSGDLEFSDENVASWWGLWGWMRRFIFTCVRALCPLYNCFNYLVFKHLIPNGFLFQHSVVAVTEFNTMEQPLYLQDIHLKRSCSAFTNHEAEQWKPLFLLKTLAPISLMGEIKAPSCF